MIEAIPATEHIVWELCQRPSRVMLSEVGVPDQEKIWREIRDSGEVVAWRVNGELVAIAGVTASTLLTSTAVVWLVTTTEVDKHSFLFLRHGRLYLTYLRQRYQRVRARCRVEQIVGTRWLKLLGFEKTGTEGVFNLYELRRD